MKLFDLVEKAKEVGGIIANDNYVFGMTYSQRYRCFLWCNFEGKAIKDYDNNKVKYKQVILSPELWEKEDWYLIEDTPNKK